MPFFPRVTHSETTKLPGTTLPQWQSRSPDSSFLTTLIWTPGAIPCLIPPFRFQTGMSTWKVWPD